MVIAVKSNPLRFMMEKSESDEPVKNSNNGQEAASGSSRTTVDIDSVGKKEFVGNSKEFRVDSNKQHLKIIGNCNKIRLMSNSGHLEVIGNSSRVKVVDNSGTISYTGNSGKVYLGKCSANKHVDYIGNCGVLKVVPEEYLNVACKKKMENCEKIPLGNGTANWESKQNATPLSSVRINASNCSSTEIRFDGNSTICLQLQNNISVPNGNLVNFPGVNNCDIRSSVRIAGNNGDIVVNSSYQV